ncbi:hypothetical protein AMAG_08681 [Allomyces macrogynus ATCC 38327]|uniref:Ubiquitin-like protease family profile domain-containing protein n=1 Tax=Allomyces macrogynus (strain ATCC 38327) TaxID=578462 RepID=A0A0L0SM33_ALLM3|nr:hypothetical protein AMAG_08681 [Allomyces macrogynus ATCC 38327]|eukprot:KNE63572.1 hypothetical protein AMAG_08681 [Allomyces macrogynus ATCC 38327]
MSAPAARYDACTVWIALGSVVMQLADHSGRELDAYLASKGRERTDLLFVYPFAGSKGVTLFGNDAGVLNDSNFLNDAVLEFYLRYLVDRLDEDQRQTVHLFNSFFFLRLTQTGNKKAAAGKGGSKKSGAAADTTAAENTIPYAEGYQHVKSWTKNVDLFERKMVFVPINENLHWYLAVILNPGKLVIKDNPPPPQTVGASSAAVPADAPAAAVGTGSTAPSSSAASAADSTAAVVADLNEVLAPPPVSASAIALSSALSSARADSATTTPSKPAAAASNLAATPTPTPPKPAISPPRPAIAPRHDAFELPPAGANDAFIVVDDDDDDEVRSGPTPCDVTSVPVPDSPPLSPASPLTSIGSTFTSPPKNGTAELAASTAATVPPPLFSMPGTTPPGIIRKYKSKSSATPDAKTRGAAAVAKDAASAAPLSPLKTKRSPDEPCILLLDSLSSGRPKQKTIDALEAYLKHEAATRRYRPHPNWAKPTRGGHSPAWPHRLAAPCPQQPNSWDCGIYVLHFVERILADTDRILQLLVSTRTEAGVLLSLFHDERPPPENDPWRNDQIKTKRLTLMRLILKLADEYIKYRKENGIDDPNSTVNALMDAADDDDDDDDVIMADPADDEQTDNDSIVASPLAKAQAKIPCTGGNKLGAAPANKWALSARNDAAAQSKGGKDKGKGKDAQESTLHKYFLPALAATSITVTHMDQQPTFDDAGPDDPLAPATKNVPVPPKTDSHVSLILDGSDSDDPMDVDVDSPASQPQSPHATWHRSEHVTFTSLSPVMGESLSSSPLQPIAAAPPLPPSPSMHVVPGETTASGMTIPGLAIPGFAVHDMPSPVRSDYLDVPVQKQEDVGTTRGHTPEMSAQHMHPRTFGTNGAMRLPSPPQPRLQERHGPIDLFSDSDENNHADSNNVDADDTVAPPPVLPEAPSAAATPLVLTITDRDARVEHVGAAEALAVADTHSAGHSWWAAVSSLLPATLTGAKPPAAAREPAAQLPPPRPSSRAPSRSSSAPLLAEHTAWLRVISSPMDPNARRSPQVPTVRGEPAHAARARTDRAESPDLGGKPSATAAADPLTQCAESMTIDDSDFDSDADTEVPALASFAVPAASSLAPHVAPALVSLAVQPPPPPPPAAAMPAPTDSVDMTGESDGDDDDIFVQKPPALEPRKRVRRGTGPNSCAASLSPPAAKRPKPQPKRNGSAPKSGAGSRARQSGLRSTMPPNGDHELLPG